MVSIDDVARRAGVSTATVSRALSGRGPVSAASRERVLLAADELGYVVSSRASSLASGRTGSVGLIVPYLDRWFFSTVLAGASYTLMQHGFDVTLYSITDNADERRNVFTHALRRQRVDGLIVVSLELAATETAALRALGMPVVAMGGKHPQLESLTVDQAGLAAVATQHLIDIGHRHIGHIGAGAEFDTDFQIPSQRRAAVEETVAACTGAHVVHEPGDFTVDGGRAATHRLLETQSPEAPRITGIVADSDEMAIGALLAANDRGLHVPTDLSVIGIDGHPLGEVFGLTTVDQFARQQGMQAAQHVLDRLDPAAALPPHCHERIPELLPTTLVVRQSTTAPRQ
ncbi:LacI family DNA-binding transcriptional regulator [Microbacterium sp. YY-01]|uniref:LacI family DNA-binding transcriptional regulator n=1 Tax=Microbacterium sp. YY-01 TaxID=3421634 RepID=UPI003D1751D5